MSLKTNDNLNQDNYAEVFLLFFPSFHTNSTTVTHTMPRVFHNISNSPFNNRCTIQHYTAQIMMVSLNKLTNK